MQNDPFSDQNLSDILYSINIYDMECLINWQMACCCNGITILSINQSSLYCNIHTYTHTEEHHISEQQQLHQYCMNTFVFLQYFFVEMCYV